MFRIGGRAIAWTETARLGLSKAASAIQVTAPVNSGKSPEFFAGLDAMKKVTSHYFLNDRTAFISTDNSVLTSEISEKAGIQTSSGIVVQIDCYAGRTQPGLVEWVRKNPLPINKMVLSLNFDIVKWCRPALETAAAMAE